MLRIKETSTKKKEVPNRPETEPVSAKLITQVAVTTEASSVQEAVCLSDQFIDFTTDT